MRCTLMLCALMLAGCTATEQPASESSSEAVSLADFAGTWEGGIMATDREDIAVNMVLTASADPSSWTMTVTNVENPDWTREVPATSVTLEGDSVMVEADPFESVIREDEQVSTRSVYWLKDGALHGTHYATYPATGEMVVLESVSTRMGESSSAH